SNAVAIVGAAAITFAVVTYDAETDYPSYWVLSPALGAMLIIASGLAGLRNVVARALATPPMVTIGLVSYGWYLWHWPLLSFLRSNFGEHDLRKALAAAFLSFILALVTYRVIELPIRNWRRRHTRRRISIALAGISACLALGSIGYWASYVGPRLLPSIAVAGLEPIAVESREFPPVSRRGLLLGDSHALVLSQRLQEDARDNGASLTLIYYPGCPPILQIGVNDQLGKRVKGCDLLHQDIVFAGSEFMIMAARWNFYLGLPPSDLYYPFSFVLADEQSEGARVEPYELLARGMAAMLAEAKRSGIRRILVIGPLPEFPVDPPYCLVRTIGIGIDGCAIDRTAVDARRAHTLEVLRRVAADV